MKDILAKITTRRSPTGDDEYLDKDIKAVAEVREIPGGLVAWWDDSWRYFVVFQWTASDDDGEWYDVVFCGQGSAGGLRECRHTWWGAEGYIFYPKRAVIVAALDVLAEWFDLT